jgi:hypothetical protein
MPVRYLASTSILYMQDILASGDVLAAACNRNLEFERTYEYLEKTTLQGQEVGHVAGLKRGSAQLNNLSGSAVDSTEAGTLFFDETARQWAEANTLMFCTWIDQPGEPSERVISFFAYITRYRAVRNNNEPANFDLDLVWTAYDVGELCPIVTFENEITAPQEFATTYSFTPSPFINSYSIALYQDGTLIETQSKDNTGALITGSFELLEQDSLYTVQITPIGYGSELCPYAFFSYSVPCPVLSLDVGETGVDVTLVPSDGITRVTVQILDSLEPLNVLDAETTDAPFPDPFTTSFTGLATTTTYWARIYQRIVVDSVVQYAKFCEVVQFTTGTPYVPPVGYTNYYATRYICGDCLNPDSTVQVALPTAHTPVYGNYYFTTTPDGYLYKLLSTPGATGPGLILGTTNSADCLCPE